MGNRHVCDVRLLAAGIINSFPTATHLWNLAERFSTLSDEDFTRQSEEFGRVCRVEGIVTGERLDRLLTAFRLYRLAIRRETAAT